jgi:hypothetical protein
VAVILLLVVVVMMIVLVVVVVVVKGKAVPLEAWSGPEGSRKLRFPDYMPTAQNGGKVVRLTHRPPLTPGNATGTHFWPQCHPKDYVNEKFQ